MKKTLQQPDGIIITVGEKMYGHHGYRIWLTNFLASMKESETNDDWFYWFRQGNQPKAEASLQFVYLSIGGKIRYRCYFAGSKGSCAMKFVNHSKEMFGKAWVLVAGPVATPDHPIYTLDIVGQKGFRGFRYTQKLF